MLDYCALPDTTEWHQPAPSWAKLERAESDRQREADRAFGAALAAAALSAGAKPLARSMEEEFAALVADWREATQNLSSLTRIISQRAYQDIIDLGKREPMVIRLILKELRANGGYWAVALNAITGENPVLPKHLGNPDKVKRDWIEWGKLRGYL